MDQKALKTELVSLYKEYLVAVQKRSKQIEDDKKDPRISVQPTFEGFIEWLDTGEVK